MKNCKNYFILISGLINNKDFEMRLFIKRKFINNSRNIQLKFHEQKI